MARWFIARNPEESCESELVAYSALDSLGDGWRIRWHYHYLEGSTSREGDFLILGPDGTLLVLEVKNKKRTFHSTGRSDDACTQNDRTASDQVSAQKSGVIKAFQNAGANRDHIPFIFPAVFYAKGNEVVPCSSSNPIPWISGPANLKRLPDLWNSLRASRRTQDTSPEIAAAFESVYGDGTAGGDSVFISATDKLLVDRAAADFSLLDTASENRQLFVTGGAGSGKSWMAERHAIRLARADEKVLFLCYNKALGTAFDQEIGRLSQIGTAGENPGGTGSITVRTWETLAHELTATLPHPPVKPAQTADTKQLVQYYDHDLPAAMLEAVKSCQPTYTALVVDEAQDHNTEWWDIYLALVRNGGQAAAGIYGDPAQRPSFRGSSFNMRSVATKFSQPAFLRLLETRRYTRPIFDYLLSLDADSTAPLIAGLSTSGLLAGPEVVLDSAADEAGAKARAAQILKHWFYEKWTTPEDTLVLTPSDPFSGENSFFTDAETLAGFPMTPAHIAATPGRPAIKATSFYKSKGLDARAVILLGTPAWKDIEASDKQVGYWLAASRARQLLAVIAHAPSPAHHP